MVRLWSDKYNRFVYVNNQTRETSFLVREIDLKRMEQSKSKWSMPSMPSCSFLPAFTTVKNCLHRLRYTVCAVILASWFNQNDYRVLIVVVILSQDTGFLRMVHSFGKSVSSVLKCFFQVLALFFGIRIH